MKRLIAVLIALIPLPAFAEPDFTANSPPISCEEALTTSQIIRCTYQEAQKADQHLNRIYRQVMSSLSTQEKRDMIKYQQAWIENRDATCETYRSTNGLHKYGHGGIF